MSKKRAAWCDLALLSPTRTYVNVTFYDQKDKRMISSVDVVLNIDYLDDAGLQAFVKSR